MVMEDLPKGRRQSERRRELRLEPIRTPQPGRQEEEGFVKGIMEQPIEGEPQKGAISSLKVSERKGEDSQCLLVIGKAPVTFSQVP